MTEIPPDQTETRAIALFAELFAAEQAARARIQAALPKGMELSQFAVLNHLSHAQSERTPAQLAKAFSVTRGAMTNTLGKLETAGWVHIRPDWDDARRKMVAISPAGRGALESAVRTLSPVVREVNEGLGPDRVRTMLPMLRMLRGHLTDG